MSFYNGGFILLHQFTRGALWRNVVSTGTVTRCPDVEARMAHPAAGAMDFTFSKPRGTEAIPMM
jgi:hypothetical protein